MVTSVAEHPAGTMPEAERQATASLTDKGKTPDETSKVSSENTPKYTEVELKAAVHAAKSEEGREKKALETERDTLKSQLATVQSDLTDNAAEIEKLQEKFDAMAADDPDKFDLAKELKAAREERKQLKAKMGAHDAEWATKQESVKLATDTLREISIWEIAAEYEAGNPVKLKDLCDTFTATSEEQIRKVADTLWTKKPTESEIPLVIPSGRTSGGGINFDDMTPEQKREYGRAHPDKKMR